MESDRSLIIKDLSELSKDVYEALGKAIDTTKQYHWEGDNIDSYLAPCITRYETKRELQKLGRQKRKYEVEENIPNNGISLVQMDYKIKVVKGVLEKDDDPASMPKPNKTTRDKKFYSQNQPFLPGIEGITKYRYFKNDQWNEFIETIRKRGNILNLILCWYVDKNFSLNRMDIICPNFIYKLSKKLDYFWYETLPDPLAELTTKSDQDDSPLSDLNIKIRLEEDMEF
jgi:hypothetical protein